MQSDAEHAAEKMTLIKLRMVMRGTHVIAAGVRDLFEVTCISHRELHIANPVPFDARLCRFDHRLRKI